MVINERQQKVLDFLIANPDRPYSVADLAFKTGISHQTLRSNIPRLLLADSKLTIYCERPLTIIYNS